MSTDSTVFLQQEDYRLDIEVNSTHPMETECYNISVNFNASFLCEYFECNAIEVVSTLNVDIDETARVTMNRSVASVIIELPISKCEVIHHHQPFLSRLMAPLVPPLHQLQLHC